MSGVITHSLLDLYMSVKGEYERLPADQRTLPGPEWEVVDELMLDLHLIEHGYATEGYEKHIDRKLNAVCADATVVERLKGLKL